MEWGTSNESERRKMRRSRKTERERYEVVVEVIIVAVVVVVVIIIERNENENEVEGRGEKFVEHQLCARITSHHIVCACVCAVRCVHCVCALLIGGDVLRQVQIKMYTHIYTQIS